MRRRARAGQFGLAVACGVGLAACSLFVGTDGLQGGSDAGSGVDASTSDVASDARVATDAATDSGAPTDGASLGFCEQNPGHKICWDFDESTLVPVTDQTSYDSSQLFVDSADSVSKPNSLVVKFAAGAGIDTNVTDKVTFDKTIAVAMDIRMTSADLTSGQLVPIYIDVPLSAGQSQHSFYLQAYYGDFAVAEGVAPDDGGSPTYYTWSLATPVPSDTWVHVELTVDGTTGVVTMSFNHTPLPNGQAIAGFPPGDGQVSVGAYSSSIPADITERLDNFIFDY